MSDKITDIFDKSTSTLQTPSPHKPAGKQVVTSKKPQSEIIKNLETLGEMIRYKRTKSKLSLKKTAQLCGISDKTLRALESGENVNTATLISIVTMLGLKLRLEE